jgi:hypothetical protein
MFEFILNRYPRQDSNLCFCLRRATLYPLSYGGEYSHIVTDFWSEYKS